jgi:hypothetical protein
MIHHADVLDALRAMPDNSFHGCLTDPPYGLSFMGHQWDHGVPSAEVWREVLRVLRPGAALLAFGGTRTFHRLTCAIEDAGFEVRDCLSWLYGSGFPKSHDVSKAIDREAGAVREVVAFAGEYIATAPATEAARQWSGHGTALKPAWEPIILARKSLDGTIAQNVQRWGCGALAIDACRVGTESTVRTSNAGTNGAGWGMGKAAHLNGSTLGRWPANVILSHSPDCVNRGTREVVSRAGKKGEAMPGYGVECAPGCPVAMLDAQTGHLHGAGYKTDGAHCKGTGKRQDLITGLGAHAAHRHGDSGGASRFFYCAKASRKERDAGLDGISPSLVSRYGEQGQGPSAQQTPRKPVEQRNIHPTVKPLALATYLARLILPPVEGSRLLVPFCGSGSEMLGGLRAGWSHVEGIDAWYVAVDIARARLA